ncbi:MAG: Anthranilate synthase component 2 [Glaciecola sp. HTCC2999]|jgi:anthranilate synthase component 2|nr:MAG: Anthranilate synthase component 2 [Glaciecola sp. HTCC2999]
MNNLSVVMLDNVDSFTYNLVDELRTLDVDMHIYRNTVNADTILNVMNELSQHRKVLLLLSPGPGAPHEAGCMLELIKKVAGHFPVLGICLGHQAIVEHYGGIISRAEAVMHGKSSAINHCGDKMFRGFDQPLPVARYHSLMASTLPDSVTQLAEVNGIPMAVYHEKDIMLGFQFHPESILTHQGSHLLASSIEFLITQQGQLTHE